MVGSGKHLLPRSVKKGAVKQNKPLVLQSLKDSLERPEVSLKRNSQPVRTGNSGKREKIG